MILATLAGLAVAVAYVLFHGSRRWDAATKAMHADLDSGRLAIGPRRYHSDELNGLPAPVQKYFRSVLEEGQPVVTAVQIALNGTINMSESGENWRKFTSTQRVIAQRPGFDWEARIHMVPFLTARVHDAYIAGEGILHASLFGLFSVAYMRGTPEMATGELIRFLAEAAWHPTSLLPSQGVQWKGLDDSSANATIKDHGTTVTLLFRFGENGLITTVRAEARGRLVKGVTVPTPWEGQWSKYEQRNGLCIPTEGEVAWLLPEGPKPYFRGCITKVRYEVAQ